MRSGGGGEGGEGSEAGGAGWRGGRAREGGLGIGRGQNRLRSTNKQCLAELCYIFGNNADLVFISVPSSSVPSSARLAGVTTVTTTTSMRRNSHYIERL